MPDVQKLSPTAHPQQRLALMLALCGAGSLGLYALLTLRYSLEQHVLLPLANLGTLSQYAPTAALLYGATMLVLMVFYLGAAWATRHAAHTTTGLSERSAQIIIIFPILAMLLLLHLYPITSLASINQTIQARVLAAHHANPYLVPASRFPADPFTTYDDAQNRPASSGPLWMLLSAVPALLAGDNLLALLLLEKMLPLLFVLGCQRLIWLITTRVAPHRRWLALLLFSWNPLLLFESAGNGHNDIAALCFVLLACYFLLAGPRWLALPALALAVLINLLALAALPFIIVALWRSAGQLRQALLALGIGGALALALGVSGFVLFGGLALLPLLFQPFSQYALSLPALLYGLLQPLYGAAEADLVVKALAWGSFLGLSLALLARQVTRTSPQRALEQRHADVFLSALFEDIFWLLMVGVTGFMPWMALWLVPLAVLRVSSPWPLVRANTLALCSLLSPLLSIFALNAALTSGALAPFTIQMLTILSLFGPVLLVLGVEWRSFRRTLLSALAAREAELRGLQYQLQHATQTAMPGMLPGDSPLSATEPETELPSEQAE